jgi:REase_DpnII-MboI
MRRAKASNDYKKRVEYLREFRRLIVKLLTPPQTRAAIQAHRLAEMERQMFRPGEPPAVVPALREEINTALPRVRRYMQEVDEVPVYISYPAPAVGGAVMRINLLDNLFIDFPGRGISPGQVLDFVDRAIGAYEDLIESGETIEQREVKGTTGLISALQQRLRPLFREEPADEKVVQSKVEDLLMVREIPFSREAETFQYSSKSYRPDFVLTTTETALEVKLSKPGRESNLIAEINDDILAYRTKYKSQIFVVYDVGGIRDEARFRGDLEAHGAVVLVIKH